MALTGDTDAASLAPADVVPVEDRHASPRELYQALLEHLRARGVAGAVPLRHEVQLLNGARV